MAIGRLEIRVAIVRRGMYHEKIGIMEDEVGQKLVFQGSANESVHALIPGFNFESIHVYPNWKEEVYELYGKPCEDRFDRLWNGRLKNTVTLELPSDTYDRIRSIYQQVSPPPDIEQVLVDQFEMTGDLSSGPFIPSVLNGQNFVMKDHQTEALKEWQAGGWRGILALATGAGKTITAIYGVVRIFEARRNAGTKTFLVVSVPYQILADQWCSVLNIFGIDPVRCYKARASWKTQLNREISNFGLLEDKNFAAAVVVNATLVRKDFQEAISRINPKHLIFIGDECHHHASEKIVKKLPECDYRLGLSATPWSALEDQKRTALESYYGGIRATYSIDQAIDEGVLSPYKYLIHCVSLSEEECEAYEHLSDQISRLFAIKEQGGSIDENQLMMLLMARARVLGSAEQKFIKLDSILQTSEVEPHTLFYCGDGSVESDVVEDRTRDVSRVAQLLHKYGWKTSRFTAEESYRQRDAIMENFRGASIDGLVAIRVLDEGFDVPSCRQAFLLASSRNERQFIQRRGRVLRVAPGKDIATIHDFLVVPSSMNIGVACFLDLVRKEMLRACEFARVAINAQEVNRDLEDMANEYKVDIKKIRQEIESQNYEHYENESI
ncbi:type III restriction enzyme, res subunit [gamma proteobacterium NOR5-3]|nr:type III restriction enzyme, res subunit [gamma proteobacterium NOR5-3]